MAKTTFQKPSFDVPPIAAPSVPDPRPLTPEPLAPPVLAKIEIPIGPPPPDGSYITNHVEARLSHTQALGLRRLWYGYDGLGSRLADGRRVQSNADAVRLLLEQIAVAAEGAISEKA